MPSSHPKYRRIVIDGFFDGSVPREVYLSTVGADGLSMIKAREYEAAIVNIVGDLGGSKVGGLFMEHLNDVGSPRAGILVMPFDGSVPGSDETHVTSAVRVHDAYARNSPLPGNKGQGTGEGSSAKIRFDPKAPSSCGVLGGAAAILFHELVHGMRAISGAMVYKRLSGYEFLEEFVAITLTNMLLSELGKPLRGGHDCQRMQSSPETFRSNYAPWLQHMKEDVKNRGLFAKLGALKEQVVPWNPLRGW